MIPDCRCNQEDCGECSARKQIESLDCSPILCESYGHKAGTKPEDCLGCATQSIVDLRAQLEACQKEKTAALEELSGLGERENKLLRKYDFVFDKWPKMDRERGPIVLDSPYCDTDLDGLTIEERWQALAFTLHTNLWEAATIARQAMENDDDEAVLAAHKEPV